MSGVEKWSVPGVCATSQNILWSTTKVNDKSRWVWHANLDKKIIQFLSVELTCATLGSDQILTLFIKRRESQGHTQLSVYPLPHHRGCRPPKHLSQPLHPLHSTAPSMTYIQSHHKSQSSHCRIPSSKPTPCPLLNLMTIGIVHQPQDHPANPDAPPVSSATRCPAISHTRHCITSLTWDLLMPLPPQFLAHLSMINIQALLLKTKNTATE
jgi:hypothetical protein